MKMNDHDSTMEHKRNVLVTGGSKGIGAAIVEQFIKEGDMVWYLSRSQSEHESRWISIAAEHTGNVKHVPCDMADNHSIEQALDTVMAEASWIDVLVNNAGITRDGLIMRMKDEAWDEVLQVNLKAMFITCRKISRVMASRRSGSIINMSSIVGITGNGGQTNYAASKAGIIGFSKSLARELASRSVRVNIVAPGFIKTSMTDILSEQIQDSLRENIPLGRIGTPEEVAKAVLFLASGDASYITGQVIAVDGGMAM
jgi:3-oxoacyl-[acyl-carrier protein] reductase